MKHDITLLDAGLPLLTVTLLMALSVGAGSSILYPPLACGAAVAWLLGRRAGFSRRRLISGAREGVRSTAVALLILVLVGALIAVWKAAGTVPAMVYYGLDMVSPSVLVPGAFLLALAVSTMLGTTIGTLSTVGVAVMGVAQGIGVPGAAVAGALISGALFGDRGSPLSGSLNLNAAMTGVEPRKAVTALLPTGVVAALLSLGGYLWMGGAAAEHGAGTEALRQAIAEQVTVSPLLLLPPALVLILAFLRVPVRRALLAGILAGAVLAAAVQGEGVLVIARAAVLGFHGGTGLPDLERLFSGGGVLSMANQILLIAVAGAFNGIMEATGMMTLLIDRLAGRVVRPLGMVVMAMLVSTGVTLVASNQALAIIVPGRMLRRPFLEKGLSPVQLSLAVADSGTVLCGLIPWNLVGLVAASTLGVAAVDYLPYAFFLWLLPLVSVCYAVWTGSRATGAGAAHRRDAESA